MNFFGHALVASWRSADPAFALGAMLPDFFSMIRARADVTGHTDVAAGVAFHHDTDRVFHRIPAFRAVEAETIDRLAAAGLARGPARGAAHVAVELCLDAVLVDEPDAVVTYLGALSLAPSLDLAWSPSGASTHWQALHSRLLARGAPSPDPGAIATRVTYALSSRPFLALDPPAAAALGRALPSILAATHGATPEILATLRAAL